MTTTAHLVNDPANDQKADAFALVLRGADRDLAAAMRETFAPFLEQTAEWERKADAIRVTDITQTKEMKLARESRLAIREIRIAIEKARKELKESALKRGQLIDACARALRERLEPIEETLREQEEYVERKEAERKAKLGTDRRAELTALGVNAAVIYPGALLGEMLPDVYADLLVNARLAKKAREEEAGRAEKERVEREKAEAAERARLDEERQARDRAQAEEHERLRAQAAAETAARAKAEAELRAAREAEEARVAAEQKRERERHEAEARAAAAPDGLKLEAWASSLPPVPDLATSEGRAIGEECERMRAKLADWTLRRARALVGAAS